VLEQLDDVLEGLLEIEADRATLEWTSGGIEVTMWRGSHGVGGMLTGPRAEAIMKEVVARAKLERRSKGTFEARIGHREMKFTAEEYDHFGETAFEIRGEL
jgi:hypothetical protein